ncbi:hypothetical protein HGP28_06125 [Vibrio sp. SM6]|uniref:Uncharacterized protein n=1 Tax=Vibrio agarilyticus TaxID=2726741 RepID=A0A7X8YGJ5_9VIBR|nr:hypothetical protein [Vibrio agarilyticus]NLS12476.1 hypothetical protein [Vibrio agarilyticus]
MSKHFITQLILITSTMISSFSYAMTDEEKNSLLQQLNNNADPQSYYSIFRNNCDNTLELLEAMLTNKMFTNQTPNTAMAFQSAFRACPHRAVDLSALGQQNYLDQSLIAKAAMLAGIDPTQLTKLSETSSNRQTPAPTRLAVGGNGGTGLSSISPN